MKVGLGLIVFSTLAAVGYGVAFSFIYPLTPIDGGLASLVAVLGLATCLVLAGLWKLLGKIFQSARDSHYSDDGGR
jgi:hypothetical protein